MNLTCESCGFASPNVYPYIIVADDLPDWPKGSGANLCDGCTAGYEHMVDPATTAYGEYV